MSHPAKRPRPGPNNLCSPERGPVDLARIRAAVRDILLAVGEDPNREGLRDTPERVARMYAELFSGLSHDPCEPLRKTFTEKYDEIVLVKDIEFTSLCEHHLMPFIGKAHIAYLPNGRIVGLSKLARAVEILARRPQVQERMTQELADLLMEQLGARGVWPAAWRPSCCCCRRRRSTRASTGPTC
jgi:GTP cyclohydrolase I